MRLLPMIVYYFWWHYTTAIIDLAHAYGNLAVFLKNFFSLDHLTRHLLSPWRRLGEKYPDYFDPEGFFSALIVNLLMRLVGLSMRLAIIGAGLAAISVSLVIFFVVLSVWLALPVVVLFLVVLGIKLLFI